MTDDDRQGGFFHIPKDRALSRRQALAVLAGIGAGGYLTYKGIQMLDNSFGDPDYDYIPKGDQSHSVRQSDVNDEYERLYTLIAETKLRAHKDGKKLAIAMGEHHYDSLSHLHTFIIADIASRLGIKDALIEQPKEKFKKLADDIASIRESQATIIDAKIDYVPSLKHIKKDYDIFKNEPEKYQLFVHAAASLDTGATNDFNIKSTRHKRYKDQETAHNFCFFNSTGMKLHCGDPERYDEKGKERDRYDPIVEQAMVDSVANLDKDCIACFGGNHLPPLVHKLRENPNIELLAIDVGNRVAVPTKKSGRIDRRRPEQIEQMISEGVVHEVVIDGSAPNFADMTEMVLRASIHHRMKNHEHDVIPPMDKRFGGMLLSMLFPIKEESVRSVPKTVLIER